MLSVFSPLRSRLDPAAAPGATLVRHAATAQGGQIEWRPGTTNTNEFEDMYFRICDL